MRESTVAVRSPIPAITLLVVLTSACKGRETLVTPSPTPNPTPTLTCIFTVAVDVSRFGPGGGTGSASVTAAAGCAWSATSQAEWVSLEGASNRVGDGQVGLTIAPFAGTAERSATLTIAQQSFTLMQTGCDFRVRPAELSFGGEGGSADVSVNAAAGCRWRLDAGAPWVSFDPPGGEGSMMVRVRADRNRSASARDLMIQVGAASLTLKQAIPAPDDPDPRPPNPGACSFTVDPVETYAASFGGTGLVSVTTSPACTWTAAAGAPWIRIRRGSSGTGPGQIEYEFDRNPSTYGIEFRRGHIEIRWPTPTAGQNVWLSQFPDCRATAAGAPPGSLGTITLPADGGTYNLLVLVDSPFTCPWRLEGSAPWVSTTLAPGVSVRGDRNVHFTALPNPSSAERTAVFTLAERSLTVRQPGR
jgi:hypothetical protein